KPAAGLAVFRPVPQSAHLPALQMSSCNVLNWRVAVLFLSVKCGWAFYGMGRVAVPQPPTREMRMGAHFPTSPRGEGEESVVLRCKGAKKAARRRASPCGCGDGLVGNQSATAGLAVVERHAGQQQGRAGPAPGRDFRIGCEIW